MMDGPHTTDTPLRPRTEDTILKLKNCLHIVQIYVRSLSNENLYLFWSFKKLCIHLWIGLPSGKLPLLAPSGRQCRVPPVKAPRLCPHLPLHHTSAAASSGARAGGGGAGGRELGPGRGGAAELGAGRGGGRSA